MEYIGTICISIKLLRNSWTSIREWFNYKHMLEEKMQTLRRNTGILSSQEEDVNVELGKPEYQFGKKPKIGVENWLKEVRHKTTEVQSIELKARKRRYLSRSQFLYLVDKNIKEVTELIEQGSFREGLLIDVHDRRELALLTTPLVGEITAERNLEKVWTCLMNNEITSIGVYGMGGVGKTTIVTHIYNRLFENPSSANYFFWFTVSQESSIQKLQNEIAKHIRLDLSNEDDERKRATRLFNALKGGKNIVLILDDMWQAFTPEQIGIPIGIDEVKLIITTRSLEVCRRMKCQEIIKVEPLSPEEAWDLFVQKLGSDNMLNLKVEEIAKSIAKECAGLPLAIITVARTMTGVYDIHDWRSALYELREYVKGFIDMEGQVFNLLKFSYNRLEDEILQQCLLYCALFPEDYKIPRVDLIVDWVAEGLIDERRSRKAKYDRGHAILNKLENVCLLESAKDTRGGICVKMHDVIRDMALNIRKDNGPAIFMVKAGAQLLEIPNEREWSENLERVSLMHNRIERQLSSFTSPNCPRLRTLLFRHNYQMTKIPNSFFMYMHNLQVLDLSFMRNLKHLPDSISNLKNLRGLLVQHCENLEYVPSLAELKELKELDLEGIGVRAVPEGLRGLVNLKRLDMFHAQNIQTIPTGLLSNLSSLQCLRLDDCMKVDVQTEELNSLRHLEMLGVHFSSLHKFNSYVNTQHWQRLSHYRLQTGDQCCYDSLLYCRQVYIEHFNLNGEEEQDEGIVLPTNMQELEIINGCLPMSLSDLSPSLKNNASRDLERCRIFYCKGIEHLWSFTTTTSPVPQNLKTLVLRSLPNLTSLFKFKGVGTEGGPPPPPSKSRIFSNLKLLSVSYCRNLKYLFTPCLVKHHFQNLQLINVFNCPELEHIILDDEEEDEEDKGNSIITFLKLKNFQLTIVPKLKSICTRTKAMVCPRLQKIHVYRCPMLKRLPLSTMHMDDNGQRSQAWSTALKKINGEDEWWDLLEWDTPEAKSVFQPLFSAEEAHPIIDDGIWWQDLSCYEEVK